MDTYNYSLNNERLKRYIVNDRDNIDEVIELYLWNISLSKELYPLISLLEVTLRNHLNNGICRNICDKWLLNTELTQVLLKDKELKVYLDCCKKLKGENKLTEGKLLAELGLGFWVNLFNKKYKVDIWHKKRLFEEVFPYFNVKTSNRIGVIYPKLKEVQYIRNRISHHEAVFDYPVGLNNFYEDSLILLSWLSPDIKTLAINISGFTNVWQKGRGILYEQQPNRRI